MDGQMETDADGKTAAACGVSEAAAVGHDMRCRWWGWHQIEHVIIVVRAQAARENLNGRHDNNDQLYSFAVVHGLASTVDSMPRSSATSRILTAEDWSL